MRLVFAFALLLLSLPEVSAQKPSSPVTRPALFLDGEALDSVILNPNPPRYGDGEEGGCIPSDEFRIDLTELAFDDAGRLRLTGGVSNADPARWMSPYIGGEMRRGTVVQQGFAIVNGRLEIVVAVEESDTLVLHAIAFRALELDVSRLAGIARRPRQ